MGESVFLTSNKQLDSSATTTAQECTRITDHLALKEEIHRSDARDEEEDDTLELDDPYTYSDDSASLSDAYFFPQPDEGFARPGRYREEDPLHCLSTENGVTLSHCYGSVIGAERADSPLWIGVAIQEDSEMMDTEAIPLMKAHGLTASVGRKGKKQLKRHQRAILKNYIKQREQVERERAVSAVRGHPQELDKCKDVSFAVIFLAQLIVVLYCAMRFGFGVLLFEDEEGDDTTWVRKFVDSWQWDRNLAKRAHNNSVDEMPYTDDNMYHQQSNGNHTVPPPASPLMVILGSGEIPFTIEYQNVIALSGIAGFYACVLTYISFGFMLILSRALIPVVLVFSIVLALAWGIIGLTFDPYGIISLLGFGSLLLALGYTMYNWARIPFAATNLHTALCGIRCTADITVLGLASLMVSFGWCIVWTMAFIGIVNKFNSTECYRTDVCLPHFADRQAPIYLMLLFSFHWTNTVIKNVMRMTVAASIGSWWFSPEEVGPFCTSSVIRPFLRAITKSLGSICLGSLVEGNIHVLQFLASAMCCLPIASSTTNKRENVSKQQNNSEIKGVAECKTTGASGLFYHLTTVRNRIKLFVRCCNRWSYIYIGMYGYSFLEAGEKAIQLFETREWMEVVRDNLISNVLTIASLIIGGSTGTFAVVVEETDGYEFTSLHKPLITAFVIGSVFGYVLSNILLLGLVGSAVNTVLVCFAAGPFEFDKKHVRLSREMREVWSQQVWEPPIG